MRKKLTQHLFVYLLILSLVITLGMYVQPLNNDTDTKPLEASPIESASILNTITTPLPTEEPIAAATVVTTPTSIPATISYSQSASIADPIAPIDPPPNNLPETVVPLQEPTAIAEKLTNTYEVTAYFLNIRKQPSAKSDIIKVVEQGSSLQITGETDNGWLELEGGGFVHGGYAKKVKNEVSVLSYAAESHRQFTIGRNENSDVKVEQMEIIDAVFEEEELTKPTSTVESDSGLSIEHIEKIFEGTALSGHNLEQAILEVEEEYGINAYFTIAVMKLESGNGKSRLAKSKNNLFGLNAIDGDKYNKAFSFKTKGDSVRKFGQLLSKNYVGKGLTTIEKVARKYCPANSKWPSLVKNIMKSDYKKL